MTRQVRRTAQRLGYTVDATGQLISDSSGTTYTYDQAGNLNSTSDGESYSYDDYGRHTSISAGGVTQTYGYDATNTRVTVDGQTQLWDRNGGLPTLISTGDGDNYVHTAGIARDGDGWQLADAVGSVRTVVDNTGAATGSQSFTAFGEQLTGSGTFGFAGEQQDPTGLQHLRARQYNPALGRFTTVDPVQPGAPGTTGYNLYAYAGNNPTTWTDPSGRLVGEYKGTLTPASTAAPAIRLTGSAAIRYQQNVRMLKLLGDIGIFCLMSVAFTGKCPPPIPFTSQGGNGTNGGQDSPPLSTTATASSQPSVTTTTVPKPATNSDSEIATTTTTSTPNGKLPVWFGQRRIGNFSAGFGRIDDPDRNFEENFRLKVFRSVEHPGILIAINNRTLAALSLSGMTSAWACEASPTNAEEKRLTDSRGPVAPATGIPTPIVAVTRSQDDLTPVAPFQVTSTVFLRPEGLLPC